LRKKKGGKRKSGVVRFSLHPSSLILASARKQAEEPDKVLLAFVATPGTRSARKRKEEKGGKKSRENNNL